MGFGSVALADFDRVTEEVQLTELPTSSWSYVARKLSTDLRNHVSMMETYYLKVDKHSNPKQALIDGMLNDPTFFSSRGGRIQYICQRGSVRSGKSVMSILKPLELLHKYPGSKWLMMRRTNSQLMGSIFTQTCELLRKFRVPFTSKNPSMSGPGIVKLPNGSMFVFISSESVVLSTETDNARGLGSFEFAGATLEEADTLHKEAVDTVPLRISQQTGCPWIIFYNVNPTRKDHWICKMFQEVEDNPHPEDYHEIQFTLWDNQAHLKPGYIDSVMAMYHNKPALLRRMVYGEWGPEANGSPYFADYFSRERHISKESFIDTWEQKSRWRDGDVVLGWDFGWRHPALVVWQDVNLNNGYFRQVRVLACWLGDEVSLGAFARYCYTQLRLMLPGANFVSYGDPQGKNKDPRGVSPLNAFDVVRAETGLHTLCCPSDPQGSTELIIDMFQRQREYKRLGSQPDIIIEPNPFYTGDFVSMIEAGYAQADKSAKGAFKPIDDDYFIHIAHAWIYGVSNRRNRLETVNRGGTLNRGGLAGGVAPRVPGSGHYYNEYLDPYEVLGQEELDNYRTAVYGF